MPDIEALFRADLAAVHNTAFTFHGDNTAPGILALLEPVKGGLVLEIGAGSGALTRHLIDAGHRVIASDASPAMLDLARINVPDAEDIRLIAMPGDPLPTVDAVVSIGHPLSYLPDESSIADALRALAGALNPGGVLAVDLWDVAANDRPRPAGARGQVADDWALITRFDAPTPTRHTMYQTVFSRNADGSWRRDDETHRMVLFDTATVPDLLRPTGMTVTIAESFGGEQLPTGLRTVLGRRSAD